MCLFKICLSNMHLFGTFLKSSKCSCGVLKILQKPTTFIIFCLYESSSFWWPLSALNLQSFKKKKKNLRFQGKQITRIQEWDSWEKENRGGCWRFWKYVGDRSEGEKAEARIQGALQIILVMEHNVIKDHVWPWTSESSHGSPDPKFPRTS